MKKFILFCISICLNSALTAQNWQSMAPGVLPIGHVIFSISALDDHTAWAVASTLENPIPLSAHIWVLRTSDGGQSWITHEIEEAPGVISFTIVAVDSLTAWITTQDFNNGQGRALYQTSDGGDTWVNRHQGLEGGVNLIRYPDGQHWLAHNRQTKAVSDDNGETWTPGFVSGYESGESQLLYCGTNMACAVGDTSWNGTSYGRIVRFTHFGDSSAFIQTGLGANAYIMSVAFQDHLNGLCYYEFGGGSPMIAKSTDGGTTWTPLANTPAGAWNIAAVPGSPDTYAIVSTYGNQLGKVSITQDFGQTWQTSSLGGFGYYANSVVFTSPNTGWIGGGKIVSNQTPAMYKYTGPPLVSTHTIQSPIGQFDILPNPSNDWASIRMTSPISCGWKVVVRDVAGKTRAQFDLDAQSSHQLDMSRFESGIYIVEGVSSEGERAVGRLVKY